MYTWHSPIVVEKGKNMLAMTTDFVQAAGCPEPYLRRIAEAGFSHVHWCHHWNTDFLYSEDEIEQIARWLQIYELHLNDLHASDGVEKYWVSFSEYERLAGVALVKNRIAMAARLESDVIILHLPREPEDATERTAFWAQTRTSLDTLAPYARKHQVRIALENLPDDNYLTIEKVLANYPSDFIGICYDSGHGNICGDGLAFLERFKHRLLAIHLHDNDGKGDQHLLPFTGTVDWERLTQLIATSGYRKCVSLESTIHHTGITSEYTFLEQAFNAGRTLTRMIEDVRRKMVEKVA